MAEFNCCSLNCNGRVNFYSILAFEMRIYQFCDEHVGEKLLFPVFVGLYPINPKEEVSDSRDICGKLLNMLTSRILDGLASNGILREVPLPVRVDEEYGFLVPRAKVPYFSGYPYYEILPHEPLVQK